MTLSMDELFEIVTKTIAEPDLQDKRKAVLVFLYFDEYLMENVPEYCGDTAFGDVDFGGFAAGQLDILEGKGTPNTH